MKKKDKKKILSIRKIKSLTKFNKKNYLDIDEDEYFNVFIFVLDYTIQFMTFLNDKIVNSILKNSKINRQQIFLDYSYFT